MAHRKNDRWRPGSWLLYLLLGAGLAGGAGLQIYLPLRHADNQAQAVVQQFMRCRLARDETCVRSYLTPALHAQYVATGKPDLIGGVDPHYQRYNIVSKRKNSDGSWVFAVRITEQRAGRGEAGWFTESIELTPVDETYQVSAVAADIYHYMPAP